jgi:hypothetical protein
MSARNSGKAALRAAARLHRQAVQAAAGARWRQAAVQPAPVTCKGDEDADARSARHEDAPGDEAQHVDTHARDADQKEDEALQERGGQSLLKGNLGAQAAQGVEEGGGQAVVGRAAGAELQPSSEGRVKGRPGRGAGPQSRYVWQVRWFEAGAGAGDGLQGAGQARVGGGLPGGRGVGGAQALGCSGGGGSAHLCQRAGWQPAASRPAKQHQRHAALQPRCKSGLEAAAGAGAGAVAAAPHQQRRRPRSC